MWIYVIVDDDFPARFVRSGIVFEKGPVSARKSYERIQKHRHSELEELEWGLVNSLTAMVGMMWNLGRLRAGFEDTPLRILPC